MKTKAKQQMRVFLSSTFVDMQEERDYLVKKIFPSIKAECRRRGVDFVALDLRWGIDEETACSGKVVEICMDEIVRSRPFFIGLIGGRYGWIPKEGDGSVTEKLLVKYPWVKECVSDGMSITEMEMQFGVLNNPDQVNALFFQKDDIAVPRKFREARGSVKAQKLADLKSAVRKAADEGRCSLMHYSSMKTLGKQVHEALMAQIEALYPLEQASRFAMYSRRMHEFLDRRREVYVRYSDVDDLSGKVMVIGSGGTGKSALVANCAESGLKEGMNLVYTVVNSDVSTAELCRRMFVYELSRQVDGIDISVLDSPADNETDLAKVLSDAGFTGRVRWVIDGLDKLILNQDKAATWLDSLPEQISELVITLSDVDEVSSVVYQNFAKVYVEPLKPGEITEITRTYLKGFAKALSSVQESHIANSALLKNPETLMVFIEELLQFGVHEKLAEFVEGYLSADTIEELYSRILMRLDMDFGFERMQTIFSWLLMCEFGVPEEALIRHLGVNNVEWVAVYAAILPFIAMNGGYLVMDDTNMSKAAEKHYGISVLRKDSGVVRTLVRMLDKENRKLRKTGDDRLYEEEGFLSYFLMKCIMASISFMAGSHISFTPEEEVRCVRNSCSKLTLLINAGKYRTAMRALKKNAFFSLVSMGADGVQRLSAIFSYPKNHVSELLNLRFALVSRMHSDFSVLSIYAVLMNALTDPQRREREKEMFLRKMKRLPFAAEDKSYTESLLNSIYGEEDLEQLLNADDHDSIMLRIMARLEDVFTILSETKLRHILQKANEAVLTVKDNDSLKDVYYMIIGVVSLRLGEPDHDKYMSLSVSDVFNASNALVHYDTYDLFKSVLKKDHEVYNSLCERVSAYKGKGLFGLEGLYYKVELARPCFYRVEQGYVDTVADEFVCMTERLSMDPADSLWNMARYFSAMRLYDVAYGLYAKSADLYGEDRYSSRVSAWRDAGYSATKAGRHRLAVSAFEQAGKIASEYPDKVENYPMWEICENLESAYRKDLRYENAAVWARKYIDELRRQGKTERLATAYNVLGIDAGALMSRPDVSPEKKIKYFNEAYDAYTEAIRLKEGGDRILAANRANLVFNSVELIGQVAGGHVDEQIRIMEDLVLSHEDMGADSRYLVETLGKGYAVAKNWKGLSILAKKYNYKDRFIDEHKYHIWYNVAQDSNSALERIVEDFLQETFRWNGYWIHIRLGEIKTLGIFEEVTDCLRKMDACQDVLMKLKSCLAMKVMAENVSDGNMAEEAMEDICRIFLEDESAFDYYDALCYRTPLHEMLISRGMARSEVDRNMTDAFIRRLMETSEYLNVGDKVEELLKSPVSLELMTALAEALVKSGSKMPVYEFLWSLNSCMDAVLPLIINGGTEGEHLRDLVSAIALDYRSKMKELDSDDVDLLFDIRENLSLECDPMLIWMKMHLNSDDGDLVIGFWEKYPDIHAHPLCRSGYICALRHKARYEEAEGLAREYIGMMEDDRDKMPVVNELIYILRNTGRYKEGLELADRYSGLVDDWSFEWAREFFLAYVGRPADALPMREQSWDDTDSDRFLKAIYLIRQGLVNDSEKIITECENPDSDDVSWLYVLYLVELARYWKNSGDVTKAKEVLAKARGYMAKSHMGMCEYEAALLGLD